MHTETVSPNLHGMFRDRLRGPDGRVLYQSGRRKNAIVGDCRRLLAGLLRGSPPASGIRGLRVGMGDPAWDAPGGLPGPNPGATALVDPSSHLVPASALSLEFLAGGVPVPSVTNVLQIAASLGPGEPPWPDPSHPSITLREFGLVAQLDGAEVLLNYVTHPAIVKDPASTLERTIWLTF